MLNLLYTVACLAVTTFFCVLVWYLISLGESGVAEVASIIWFGFIVWFLTLIEREDRGNDSSLLGNQY
ncbi:hypothetical protein M5V91_11140 [Cytobacillus pseudoceanisediminis]|uniref:hypothetical protein n=1 Tax=Cytobacillus pseudoceanisediminis TaxID=3051614 RepID=UPI00218C3DFD|nr:hypothetical protein [Cytobacillus pseudoceanisediminis]UQX56129.1 hypothetical protein M5V91_11140 [Cytobacillus pseudoceanisediminis]